MAIATQTFTQLPPASASFRPSLSELFLTNLRLLDFDKRPDWPNITPKTYTTKDGQNQNQKQRIKCTEWVLYRLFELWDPEETRDVRLQKSSTCPAANSSIPSRNSTRSSRLLNHCSRLTYVPLYIEC
jgi:HAUS augmin-like complex subunit 6 N-terminus